MQFPLYFSYLRSHFGSRDHKAEDWNETAVVLSYGANISRAKMFTSECFQSGSKKYESNVLWTEKFFRAVFFFPVLEKLTDFFTLFYAKQIGKHHTITIFVVFNILLLRSSFYLDQFAVFMIWNIFTDPGFWEMQHNSSAYHRELCFISSSVYKTQDDLEHDLEHFTELNIVTVMHDCSAK